MKNIFTVLALMLSMAGIGVSLAREEVRCYLGLSSQACQANNNNNNPTAEEHKDSWIPEFKKPSPSSEGQQTEPPQSNPSEKAVTQPEPEVTEPSSVSKDNTDKNSPETQPVINQEAIKPAETQENKEVKPVDNKVSEPSNSSSPETVEPLTKSVPLEVIPPPESNNNSSANDSN